MALSTTHLTNQADPELVNWLAGCLGPGDLAPLSCDDLEELAGHLTEEHHAAGTLIYERGDLPTRVHILRAGAVELTRDLGGRRVVVQLLRAGSVFGDVPLFLRRGDVAVQLQNEFPEIGFQRDDRVFRVSNVVS